MADEHRLISVLFESKMGASQYWESEQLRRKSPSYVAGKRDLEQDLIVYKAPLGLGDPAAYDSFAKCPAGAWILFLNDEAIFLCSLLPAETVEFWHGGLFSRQE